jgi:hypothetical protein
MAQFVDAVTTETSCLASLLRRRKRAAISARGGRSAPTVQRELTPIYYKKDAFLRPLQTPACGQ